MFHRSLSLSRQLNSIRVLLIAFVFLGKNFFEPMGLTLGDCTIQKFGIVKDDKFLATLVAAKSAHLCKAGRTLPRLTFLYRYCSHLLLHSIGTFSRGGCDRLE